MAASSTDSVFTASHFGGIPSTYSSVATDPNSSDISTADTIALMAQYAEQYSDSPEVQEAVRQATSFLPAPISAEEATQAIYDWVKWHVHFVTDEAVLADVFGKGPESELVLTPPRILTMPKPMGDCDCISTLLGSMLIGSKSGVGVSFVTVAVDDAQPDRFSHVYVLAELPCGARIPLDASHGPEAGWEVDGVYRKEVYEVSQPQGYGGKKMQGLGVDWGSLLTSGVEATTDILAARYGVPPAGTYIQTKEGSVLRTTPGPSAGIFPPTSLPGGGGEILKWLLIAGAVIAGISMLRGRG